jgi:tRNA pseudouridine-54 N-methylase
MSREKNDKKIIKAFFESSKNDSKLNLKIISLLNKYNCNVMQTVIGSDLSYLSDSSEKAAINIFSDKIKDIIDCDVFICEITENVPSLFFLIFEALERKKPVLALYEEGTSINEEWLNQKYDVFYLEKYNNKSLEETISNFLSVVQTKLLTSRFTIRLNEELCTYTDFLKTKYGCSSRNDVIFKLLNDAKKEDYTFQELMEENS